MAKAIMDPEEVRRFARDLKMLTTELEARLSNLHARLSALGEAWQDQEHDKFAVEFEDTMRGLGRFTYSANEHIPFLLRKARHIEDYLDQG
ncbi:MAG: hypothetical protein ACI8W8_002560 [Rhodothermales bacterium]|jgi:uncharacterized protein YukE